MQAIILAAGMGKRLKNLTKNNTKCMVEVNGISLIERMLKQLDALKLKQIVIVVGYKADNLIEYIETLQVATKIIFVENKVYDKTNNIFSLALAQDYLCEDDTLLLESDLIFEDEVLAEIINDERDTLALVDKYESWMDGTVVKIDGDDNIQAFVPGSKFVFEDIPYYYKTVNIYKFSRDFSKTHYVPFLEAYTKALGNNEYYEQVLRVITLLDDPVIKAKKINGRLWYEIDDVQDLDIASSMFVDSDDKKLELLQKRYGGYWRYPKVLNFCYPDNPFFPPDKLINEIKANTNKLISEYPSGIEVNSLLAAKNLGINSENVVVANGVEELIKSIMTMVDGKIGIVKPTNEEYINRHGLESMEIFVPSDGDLTYTVDDVITYFDKKEIVMLILINPDYHSGNYIEKRNIKKLLQWSQKKKIKILIDESYCDFADEKDNSLIKQEIFRGFSNLIVLKNLSATHGVSGIRLGCAVSSDMEMIKDIKDDVTIWNINSFAEFYLQIEEKYKKDYIKSLEMFRRVKEKFLEDITQIEGLRVIPSQANYVMCEVIKKYSAQELTKILLVKYNILIKDLTDRVESRCQYVKFAIRTSEENEILMQALIEILGRRENRISGKTVDINEIQTKDFFRNRTKKELPHRYNYVIYQDSNPELAIERDKYEKEKMISYLKLKRDSLVLDVGCGVGRWGDEIVKYLIDGKYVGIDFSEELLKVAKENLKEFESCCFLQGSFQEIQNVLDENNLNEQFDTILINGVLMYINDSDIEKCLESVDGLLKTKGRIYIKESVGVEQRFTLRDFYSEELSSTYNAIYRSLKEYHQLFERKFIDKGYKVISDGETWTQEQKNRTETLSYYWILEK